MSRQHLTSAILGLALASAVPTTLVGEKIALRMEACEDAGCRRGIALTAREIRTLEPTLWDSRARRGLVSLAPARSGGLLEFQTRGGRYDQIAFSPTRPMESLYTVDRLRFLPLASAPPVLRGPDGVWTVRLARRPGTMLLPLGGSPDTSCTAAPVFLGITWTIFGWARTKGLPVLWGGAAHLAFPGMKPGGRYALECRDPRGAHPRRVVVWQGSYHPIASTKRSQ